MLRVVAKPEHCLPKTQRRQSQMGNIAMALHSVQLKCSMTVPSEMVGAAAPVLPALFAIQSRAARMLSSVPALSWHTVTENPPSAVRAIE